MLRFRSPFKSQMSSNSNTVPSTSTEIAYAGLVSDLNFTSIDPSGRTDLLKILDTAQADGSISRFGTACGEIGIHELVVKQYHIEVKFAGKEAVLLSVPLHLIASVGYISEEGHHLVCINIAPDEQNPQTRDIAVLCLRNKTEAESLCSRLTARFHSVYRESIQRDLTDQKSKSNGSPLSSPGHRHNGAALALASAGTRDTSTSIYTASSTSNNANEYIALLSSSLSDDELREFAELLRRWQLGELPIKELAYKLMELYGTTRRHLLTRLRHLISADDQAVFREFLLLHNISESSGSGVSASSSVHI